ncbi:MAG: hypothetical protein MI743_17680 [Sneathiellales bacterium]|nr:hypothetical protein [Sneathiellales bacterium]
MVVALIVAHFLTTLIPQLAEKESINRFFHMGEEQNLPTFFSTMNLLLSSTLLFLIASLSSKNKRKETIYWFVLGVIFVFLAIDEFTFIHETISAITRRSLKTEGYLFFAWVIPYAFVLLVIAVFYFRFLLLIPKKTCRQFIVAGGVYICGAMGLEVISSGHAYSEGVETLTYNVLNACEETLEMIGIILFIQALFEYLYAQWEGFYIRIDPKN